MGQVAIMVDVDDQGTGHVAIITSNYKDKYAYSGSAWVLPVSGNCSCK